MSRFIFIHDFYRDGYNDMLAEVRVLQECGLWTRHKRASITRHAVSEYWHLKHKFPRMDASYWAGRLAALKSAVTADYRASHKETGGTMIILPLPDGLSALCGNCGDPALWCYSEGGKGSHVLFRCDPCKQELVRERTCYSVPDGWDWNEHEPLPLPVPVGDKLVVKKRLEPATIFLPPTALAGLGLLDMTLHIPILLFVTQAVFLLHFMIWGKSALKRFLTWIESEL